CPSSVRDCRDSPTGGRMCLIGESLRQMVRGTRLWATRWRFRVCGGLAREFRWWTTCSVDHPQPERPDLQFQLQALADGVGVGTGGIAAVSIDQNALDDVRWQARDVQRLAQRLAEEFPNFPFQHDFLSLRRAVKGRRRTSLPPRPSLSCAYHSQQERNPWMSESMRSPSTMGTRSSGIVLSNTRARYGSP